MIVWRGSLPALIYPGDRITWKVPAVYSWSPTTTQSGSFLCTAASSMPIRVVTKEVRYIHELSLTLEHSISISSPAVPGLTVTVMMMQTWEHLQQSMLCHLHSRQCNHSGHLQLGTSTHILHPCSRACLVRLRAWQLRCRIR